MDKVKKKIKSAFDIVPMKPIFKIIKQSET